MHRSAIRRPLVALALALSLVGLVVPSSLVPSGGEAVAMGKRDGCPGKLGALRLSSSRLGEESSNVGEVKCIYQAEDYRSVILRVAWLLESASPTWLSDFESDYCLRADDDVVGFGQHGDDTRTGFTFPHAGERYILASYIATSNGPSVGQIKKVARKVVSEHTELAATCPGAAGAGSSDIVDGSASESIEDCLPLSDDGAETDVGSAGTAFLSADTASSPDRIAQAGPRCPLDVIGVGLLVRDIFDDMGVSLADPSREPGFDRAAMENCFGRSDMFLAVLEKGDANTRLAADLTCLLLGDRSAETDDEVPLLVWMLLLRAIEQQQPDPAASE